MYCWVHSMRTGEIKATDQQTNFSFVLLYCKFTKGKNQEGAAKLCLHSIIELNFSTASFQLQNLYLILDQLFRQNLQTVFASAHIINTCDCDDDDKFSHKQQAPHYRQSSSLCHLLCGASWGLSMCDLPYEMDTLAFAAAFAARINQTEKKKKKKKAAIINGI